MTQQEQIEQARTTWRDDAIELFGKIDKALDGGEQIQLIATALQDVYEKGIGDGIAMENGMTTEHIAAEVEKATAELRSDIQEREIVVAEEKDALRAEYEFQLTEADRLAREECAKIADNWEHDPDEMFAGISIAQAIRATVKEK